MIDTRRNHRGQGAPPRRGALRHVAAAVAVILALWPVPGRAEGCPGADCETRLVGPSPRGPRPRLAAETAGTGAKVSGRLRRVMAAARERVAAGDRAEALRHLSTRLVRVSAPGRIQVQVKLAEHRPEHVARLEALGLEVEHSLAQHRLVQGWASPAAIEAMAGLDVVRQIAPPGYALREGVGAQNTAGDAILRAAEARNALGVTGAGVVVGILSDGVDHLAPSVSSGDVPGGVQVLRNPGGVEGTAMSEIVKDVAPGAALAFYGPDTDVDMAVGIDALRAAGARVVVDDLTFFNQSKFEDDVIAQAQRAFATDGRVYVTAAGNRALQHYRSAYRRRPGPFLVDYAAAHDHGTDDIGNTLAIPPGCGLLVNLHWNNRKGQSADDFDLVLIRQSTGDVLEASIDEQTGTQDPYESLEYVNASGASVTVFIAVLEYQLASPPASIVLDYFASVDCAPDPQLQYTVTDDSVPGNHAVEETVVVAAVNAGASGVAGYSSRGPTTVAFPAPRVRRVPNVSATDCVRTRVGDLGFFDFSFCGTSASAPHVAGIAALVIERNPGLGSRELHGLLTGTAAEVGPAGYDFTAGFGLADAFRAVTGAAPGGPVLFSSILPASRAVAPGATATAFLTILNAGQSPATGVRVLPGLPVPAVLGVTETDPATNAPIGALDAPVDIAPGGLRTFVLSLATQAEIAPTDVLFNMVGANTGPAPTLVGVNSVLLSAAPGVPDVVALAATVGRDGIVRVAGVGATGFFSVATVNLGAGGPVTATVDTGGASLPVGVFVCQTDPVTSACRAPLAPSVPTTIGAGQTPTFAVFVAASGPVAFDPGLHRVFVRFRDGLGIVRGATSVALLVL